MYEGDQPGDPKSERKTHFDMRIEIDELDEPGVDEKLKEEIYDIEKETINPPLQKTSKQMGQLYGAEITVVYDYFGSGATISKYSESLATQGAIIKKFLRNPKYSLTQLKYIFNVMSKQGFHLHDIEFVPEAVQNTMLSFELRLLFFQDKNKEFRYKIIELKEGAEVNHIHGKWEEVCTSRLDMIKHSPPRFMILSEDIARYTKRGEGDQVKQWENMVSLDEEEVEKYYDMMMGLSNKNIWDYISPSEGKGELVVRFFVATSAASTHQSSDIGNIIDYPSIFSRLNTWEFNDSPAGRIRVLKELFNAMADQGYVLKSVRLIPTREMGKIFFLNGYYLMIKFLNIGCNANLEYTILSAGSRDEVVSRTKLSRSDKDLIYDIFFSKKGSEVKNRQKVLRKTKESKDEMKMRRGMRYHAALGEGDIERNYRWWYGVDRLDRELEEELII